MATVPPPRLAGNEDAHAKILLDYAQRLFNSIKDMRAVLLPIGAAIDWFHPTSIPPNYLEANGQAVSRKTYPDLYTALGGASSPWGHGDGTTTFNLPNLVGTTTIGAGSRSGLTTRTVGQQFGEETHRLTQGEMVGSSAGTGVGTTTTTTSPAAHNNMQPSTVVRKVIRAL